MRNRALESLSRILRFNDNGWLGMTRRTSILILLILAIGINVGTSGWPPLLDSSDAGHAEAARERLVYHQWVILHMDVIRYLESPPLHYRLVAISYAVYAIVTTSTLLPLAH